MAARCPTADTPRRSARDDSARARRARSDRANRTTMNVLVNGYIIPSGINAAMAGPSPKSYNVTKTVFKETII